MRNKTFLIVMLLATSLWAYEVDLPEETSACSLSMKIALDTVNPTDNVGRATVEIRVLDKSGAPLSGYNLQLGSTGGTFICESSGIAADGEADEGRSCFTTDFDGIARIRLVSIPMNMQVQITASCNCGDYEIRTAGNLKVTHGTVKKTKTK